uniref:MARVEL domain-containing protein n=1 Tax=Bombyx mori TaxID=7091 RepID=A0A8R2C5I6_BOMMO|nr:uncharacterized protein LOC101742249 isoform X1 [Bombyx mori]
MLVCCPLPTSQSFRHCTLVNTRIQLSSFSLEIKKKTMSCSMTITRTTVATSGTSVYVNTGYLQTLPGLLKLAQFLLGIACVALVAYYMDHGYSTQSYKPELFFLLISVTFLIGTFCLLLSCLISLATATVISKTIYEVIYHGIAFILYLCAGLTLLIEVNHQTRYRRDFEPFLAASIMGLVMAGLYLLSTFLANRRYRGI